MPLRLWLVGCAWCLLCWTALAQASWEAYQRAGEAAYSRGHYAAAERLFLAAVREARHFSPQDPRLDISLNNLALIRVTRDQHANTARRSQPTARHKQIARQGRVARHGHRRPPLRTALQPAKPGRHQQVLLSRRAGERRKGARSSREASRQAPQVRRGHQIQRPRVTIRHAGPKQPGRRARPDSKRRAARSPRRAMLHAGPPCIAQLWLQQGAMA